MLSKQALIYCASHVHLNLGMKYTFCSVFYVGPSLNACCTIQLVETINFECHDPSAKSATLKAAKQSNTLVLVSSVSALLWFT